MPLEFCFVNVLEVYGSEEKRMVSREKSSFLERVIAGVAIFCLVLSFSLEIFDNFEDNPEKCTLFTSWDLISFW